MRSKGATVTPSTVTIRGPSKDLARIDALATEPLVIDKATADDVGTVDLAALPGMLRLETEAVTASVSIGPILVEKQFRLVQVVIRNSAYRSRIAPTRVTLMLARTGSHARQAGPEGYGLCRRRQRAAWNV